MTIIKGFYLEGIWLWRISGKYLKKMIMVRLKGIIWSKYQDDHTYGSGSYKYDARLMTKMVLNLALLEIHPQCYSKITCR